MFTKTWFDYIPLWVVWLGTVGTVLLFIEGGYRLAMYRKKSSGTGNDAPISSVIGSTLGLLAFLLSFTFGMAASRFDTRRQLLLDEVNSIGTVYLRTDLVPDPERSEIRKRLREYVHLRAGTIKQQTKLKEAVTLSETLQNEIWSQAVGVAPKDRNSPTYALFLASLNDMIDNHTKRTVVVQYRIPVIIWTSLYAISILSMAGVGYQFGRAGTRDVTVNLILAPAFSIVICLIADLDRVHEGTLQVSQQPMIELAQKLEASEP